MTEEQLEEFKNSGILPMEVYDDTDKSEPTTEITICDSISGGAQEIDNMPRTISLVRLKLINGEWKEFRAEYIMRMTDIPRL
jgi:hypothetical protein